MIGVGVGCALRPDWANNMAPRWLRESSLATVGVILFIILGGLFLLRTVSVRLQAVYSAVNESSNQQLVAVIREGVLGFATGLTTPHRLQRWLILGLDEVEGSGRQATLADSLFMVSVNPEIKQIALVSLPRDWWHPDYKAKINALYAYAVQNNPNNPLAELNETLGSLLGLPLEGMLTITLSDLAKLVDMVGGVTVDVERSFVDEKFPRTGIDVTVEQDPEVLYQTVEFAAGQESMNGERALQYIRSRNSADPLEGNDEARQARQQRLLAALIKRLNEPSFWQDGRRIGELIAWYVERWGEDLSPWQFGFIAGQLAKQGAIPNVNRLTIPATFAAKSEENDVLLVHPDPRLYDGQWVYVLADPTGEKWRMWLETNRL